MYVQAQTRDARGVRVADDSQVERTYRERSADAAANIKEAFNILEGRFASSEFSLHSCFS